MAKRSKFFITLILIIIFVVSLVFPSYQDSNLIVSANDVDSYGNSLLATAGRYMSANHSGERTQKISKITPHVMEDNNNWTGKDCAEYFYTNPEGRMASCNYAIGYDGDIAVSVDEKYIAWTSSNPENDAVAVTIEVSCKNDSVNTVTEASWNALVKLCADICIRNDFRLEYTGDASGSLTEHRMFANKSCPGDYMHSRMKQLAEEVNDLADKGGSTSTTTDDSKDVTVTASKHSNASQGLASKGYEGTNMKNDHSDLLVASESYANIIGTAKQQALFSEEQKEIMALLNDEIESREVNVWDIIKWIMVALGLIICIYSTILLCCLCLDLALAGDFNLVTTASFGKYKIVSKTAQGKPRNKKSGRKYLYSYEFILRTFVWFGIGLMLSSGMILKLINELLLILYGG